jgi:DNA-nicking Smr family endonuclease
VSRHDGDPGPAPDWRIDLHGCTVEEARKKLRMAVQNCRYQRYHTLLVVTGRGLHTASGSAVLTPAVLEWLASEEARAAGVERYALSSRGGAVEVELR